MMVLNSGRVRRCGVERRSHVRRLLVACTARVAAEASWVREVSS
jgi:hypothetical protein